MATKGEVSSEQQLLGEARKGFAWSLATHLEDIQDENNPVGEVLTAVCISKNSLCTEKEYV